MCQASKMNDRKIIRTAEDVAPAGVFIEAFQLGKGPLRVAVKDTVDIAGIPTRLGSGAYDNAPPAAKHADIVERLLAGDATIVGKTNMHEIAYGVTGLNSRYGTPRNTNFPALIPGGSSSGSAVAVAAGLCDAAIGTDTGGSIRIPAACCGVLGLKPTFDRVSRAGLIPATSSLDCVGPFASNATLLDQIMSMIAPDWKGARRGPAARIAWLKCGAAPGIWQAAYSAASSLCGDLDEVESNHFSDANDAGLSIIARETHAAFGHLIEGSRLDPDVAARLSRATGITDEQIANAEKVRVDFTEEIDALLKDYDALALPTLGDYPPRLEDAGDLMAMVNITRLCRPFNLSGHPAISIPLAPINGKPVSLQLVAAKGNDERLVALAKELENASENDFSAQGSDECCN